MNPIAAHGGGVDFEPCAVVRVAGHVDATIDRHTPVIGGVCARQSTRGNKYARTGISSAPALAVQNPSVVDNKLGVNEKLDVAVADDAADDGLVGVVAVADAQRMRLHHGREAAIVGVKRERAAVQDRQGLEHKHVGTATVRARHVVKGGVPLPPDAEILEAPICTLAAG